MRESELPGEQCRWVVVRLAHALLLFALLCMTSTPLLAQPDTTANPVDATGPVDENYRLGAGDRLRIDVFNQPDITGEYVLDGSGRISMHLIGQVEARGLTAAELEQRLVARFKPDYLVNPRVSVHVLTYRPFYIIGEVNSAGDYPFVDGMTYLNAIAIAGGYTFRAKEGVVYVKRSGAPRDDEIKLSVNDPVQPGDIIRVDERLF